MIYRERALQACPSASRDFDAAIPTNDPVTTDPKGEALEVLSKATRRLLSIPFEAMRTLRYSPRQDEDIVCATRNRGRTYDVGSSHPGGGEAPKGLAVRQ